MKLKTKNLGRVAFIGLLLIVVVALSGCTDDDLIFLLVPEPEECGEGGKCDYGYMCDSDLKCRPCGKDRYPCCEGNTCLEGHKCNTEKVCEKYKSGWYEQPCAEGNKYYDDQMICFKNECTFCGYYKQPCCDGDFCNAGGSCSIDDGLCYCGHEGESCCYGTTCYEGACRTSDRTCHTE